MNVIEKVTNNQAKARSIYNSLIKDNIFYTGISKNLAIALIELGIDSSTTDKLSVEKLQEQLNTAKMALTEIAYGEYNTFKLSAVPIAKQALAAIEKGENNEI